MKKPVVEFMGLPKAGKTSHIEMVARELRALGYLVRFIQDQIRDAPLKGDEVEKNKWAIREVGNLIAEAKEQDWDLILVERGGWALYASLKALLRQLKKKRQIRKARRGLGLAIDVVLAEDFFILIEVFPEVALKRDQQLGATQAGTIINLPFLRALGEVYQCVRERLPRGRTKIVNGQEDFQENQEKILKSLLRLLEDKTEASNSSANRKVKREKKEVHYG